MLAPTQAQLEAAHCWEADDFLTRDSAMTEFRRSTRYHHALWREAQGHPIGTQPYKPLPGKASHLVGSRMPLDYAQDTGANLITPNALAAARDRTSFIEREQSLDHQRLSADLLSSEALAFNLFGDLWANLSAADKAVRRLWPVAPGTVSAVRFGHSPGRLNPEYLKSLRAFDASFVTDLADGTHGVVAIDTNYHERAKAETPKPENWWRYSEVAERAGIFKPGAVGSLRGRTSIAVMWLEHLLLHSMHQHPSGAWSWGLYVVAYPARNTDLAVMVDRYRDLLTDDSTFRPMTLEDLLDAKALPKTTTELLRERYLP